MQIGTYFEAHKRHSTNSQKLPERKGRDTFQGLSWKLYIEYYEITKDN